MNKTFLSLTVVVVSISLHTALSNMISTSYTLSKQQSILSPITTYGITSFNLKDEFNSNKQYSKFNFFKPYDFYKNNGYIRATINNGKLQPIDETHIPVEFRGNIMGTQYEPLFMKYTLIANLDYSLYNDYLYAVADNDQVYKIPKTELTRLAQEALDREKEDDNFLNYTLYKNLLPYISLIIIILIWLPSIYRKLRSKLSFESIEFNFSFKWNKDKK